MATILFRIISLYNLLNAIFLAMVPKKLRSFLPQSWYPQLQQQQHQHQPQQQQSKNHHRRADSDDLHRVFQMFDHNRDGRITNDELRDSLESIGIFVSTTDLNRMIEEIDVDGDGCIDMYEFKKLYRSIAEEKDGDDDDGKDELVKEAFDVFDQNGDGFITVDELWSVLASLGMKQGRAADDCRRMIGKVDADGDGRVNFVEFKRMLKGGGFAALTSQ
ncbi:calmodulin-like protein 3 [Impatiens glandulifera]|uniref:calmodulin-like protein 3 n=1 Tax=Impatiens glandulifera TaxID=253017 RepID=UPI001FB0EF0B|nr:calmodulin-like protein 3 [Impatiens glandulifera]